MNNRVKYYAQNDLLYGMHFSKIETLVVPEFQDISINDAIEFYQMKQYFDAGLRLTSWSEVDYASYKQKQVKLTALCFRYFNSLSDQTILQAFSTVDIHYTSAFWELFDLCNRYNVISDQTFQMLLQEKHIHPRDIFEKRNIVMRYDAVLKQFILDNLHLIHILVDAYEQEYTDKKKVYLPSELTGEEICAYFAQYINSKEAAVHILESIYQMKPTKEFPITDVIRVQAKKKYDEQVRVVLETGIKAESNITVAFSPEQVDAVVENYSETEIKISYSTPWLLDTLDFPSILNNFLYLFHYADLYQMRCLLVSKTSDASTLEKFFANKNLSCYYPANNMAFITTNGLARIQMHAYYDFLKHNNINLEDVFVWFFTSYLQEEFGCPEMRVVMPSAGANYYEKCTTLCSAFDTILRQFSLYTEYRAIDFDLISLSSGGKKYDQIPSLIKHKYLSGTGEQFNRLTFWMFSDQCTFSYVERIHNQGKEYATLFELLSNEDIYTSDYREWEKDAFIELKDEGLLQIDDSGRMSLRHDVELRVLYDLYKNEVVSRYHYPKTAEPVFVRWISKGLLKEEEGLFSKPEVNYLNYLLNHAEYTNGLDLRNRYMHGTQAVNVDEKEHRDNYFILLIVLVIFIIKINDDFLLAEHLEKDDSTE